MNTLNNVSVQQYFDIQEVSMPNLNLTEEFRKIFNTTVTPQIFFAPGRINLIGEHTDYNGGHVFPASISFGTYAVARKRTDQQFNFYSRSEERRVGKEDRSRCSKSKIKRNIEE